jgi:large conductance mechanosensitive channel
MIKEFREFISKGNVLDLAVAVLIGTAFGKIVDSFVKDILTPILTPITPRGDFASYKAGPFGVGSFTNNVIQFVIVAVVLFLIVKAVNRFNRPVEAPIVVDLAAENVAQNQRIIALLEELVAKPAQP